MRAAFAFALAGVLATATAQLGDLPQCAQTCAISTISDAPGCSQGDFACYCKSSQYIQANIDCAQKSCPASDLQAGIQGAVKVCQTFGVSVSLPSLSSTAGASGSGSVSGSGAPATMTGSGTTPAASSTPSAHNGAASFGAPAVLGALAFAAGAALF